MLVSLAPWACNKAHTRAAPASDGTACGVASSSLSSMITRRLTGRAAAAPTSGLLPQVSRLAVGSLPGKWTLGGVRARFAGRPASASAAPLLCAGWTPFPSCHVRVLITACYPLRQDFGRAIQAGALQAAQLLLAWLNRAHAMSGLQAEAYQKGTKQSAADMPC